MTPLGSALSYGNTGTARTQRSSVAAHRNNDDEYCP
jgi:hypothetical protein